MIRTLRLIEKLLLRHSADDLKAWKRLCSTAFACEADAQQALTRFIQGAQATFLATSTVRAQPCYGKRGRPGRNTPPTQVVYQVAGALASSLAGHHSLLEQPSCFILATNELDEARLAPPAVLHGYNGPQHAERGFRFLKDPQFLAASLYLKKPERIMALFMVMTVCLLVYAALEYRIRTALKEQEATLPNQKGQRIPNPTARWVLQ